MTIVERLKRIVGHVMAGTGDGLKLHWLYGLIGLAPLLAYAGSEWLLHNFGMRFDWIPDYFAEYDSSREMAARLNVLGALVLVTASAFAAFIFFFSTLSFLRWREIGLVTAILALVAVMIGGASFAAAKAEPFAISPLMCASHSYDEAASNKWKLKAQPADKDKPARVSARNGLSKGCADKKLWEIHQLEQIDMAAVLVGLLSLIAGSIFCLATLADERATAAEKVAHYERQSERLNGYLYLSALLLVTGLMFVAAMLRWPTYALIDSSSYESHVNALTAYYGVSYTVLIASFYIPVAAILTRRVREHKHEDSQRGAVPDAFKGPLQIFKIASALFSTTFAGIASSLISLGG